MTLDEWATLQPYAVRAPGGWKDSAGRPTESPARYIPDSLNLVQRAEAFHLSDYLVSAITGGTIWFWPRHRGSAHYSMLERGVAD